MNSIISDQLINCHVCHLQIQEKIPKSQMERTSQPEAEANRYGIVALIKRISALPHII